MSDIEKNRYNWNGPPIVYGPVEENDNDRTIIDLFSGPGGISEGFKQEGFSSIIAADIHEISLDTYRYNHPEAYSILTNVKKINGQTHNNSDIKDVISEDNYGDDSVLSKILEKTDTKNVDVLAGGIPCQGFSISNKKRSDDDERNYLFEEMVKATKILDPSFILLENVSTMKSAKEGGFVDEIHKCFDLMGYHSEHKVLNSANFGVPQKRHRLFFLASKSNSKISWPKKTYEDSHISVEKAISDLEKLDPYESGKKYINTPKNEYQEKLRSNANTYENHSAPRHREKTVNRIKNTQQGEPMYEKFKQRIRLNNDKPSPTIVSGGIRPQFQFGHPSQNRGLTVRERARLQSFPDSYTFEGGLTQGRVQTGMAVPPIMASKIAKEVNKMI